MMKSKKEKQTKKATKTKKKALSPTQWESLAERKLKRILQLAEGVPGLAKLGPSATWKVEVRLVGSRSMIQLNSSYRGKSYATDVLSFPTLSPFRDAGQLGDLVVCLPTLKSQAKALGHKPEQELEILLVHGVLHLLGLDHERGVQEAKKMARWEKQLLGENYLGLIDRSGSGNERV
jgi:probable rRNA maturation factor